jgi:hypothetical protein
MTTLIRRLHGLTQDALLKKSDALARAIVQRALQVSTLRKSHADFG